MPRSTQGLRQLYSRLLPRPECAASISALCTVKQAEDQDCQHSDADCCVQSISFQCKGNDGEDYARDRSCYQVAGFRPE